MTVAVPALKTMDSEAPAENCGAPPTGEFVAVTGAAAGGWSDDDADGHTIDPEPPLLA